MNLYLFLIKIFLFFICRHVRDFYQEVTAKMVQKFPFKDETLKKTLGFVNPTLKEVVPVESGKNFFHQY